MRGKSPLIGFLVPVVGGIIGLVGAALQGVSSLIAVISTLPALLGAIALQGLVLYTVFHGMGKAIKEAFNATNAKELDAALKHLGKPAQDFVKSLLPLKPLFHDLKTIIQDNFFRAFGDSVTKVVDALGPIFKVTLGPLAAALGGLFRNLALFFASKSFQKFVSDVIPATIDWLKQFGPSLVDLLTGLADFSVAALPFLSTLGKMLSGNLSALGTEFSDLAKDPATKKWFDDMATTFQDLVEAIGQLGKFVFVFLAQLNTAGGDKILKALADAVEQITFVLASPVGQRALEGFVRLSILGIQAFAGLVIVILGVLAALETMWQWITGTFYPGMLKFFKGIPDLLWDSVKAAANWISWLIDQIDHLITWIVSGFSHLVSGAGHWIGKLTDKISEIPGMILSALSGLGSMLEEKGANMIKSLINGIKSEFGNLKNVWHRATSIIGDFLGNSPAKEGPLSGSGWTEHRGRRMIRALGDGIRAEGAMSLAPSMSTAMSNISLGGVNLNFYGQQPTEADARRAGTAAGRAAATQIATRDAQLAVRLM